MNHYAPTPQNFQSVAPTTPPDTAISPQPATSEGNSSGTAAGLPNIPVCYRFGERSAQRQFIEDARALLKPSRVEVNKVPRWFRRAILDAFRGTGMFRNQECYSGLPVLHTVRKRLGLRWLDHVGTCDWYGKRAFVTEPYGIDAEALKSAQDFASRIGCECALSSNSWHSPGATLRIVFFEKDAGDTLGMERTRKNRKV